MNFMNIRHLLFFISFFVVRTAYSQSQATTGEIRGLVYDKETGEPIIFTNVFIRTLMVGKATDINGFYAITKLQPGTYTVECFSIGYDTVQVTLTVSEGKITTQNL
jgi:hypothetical protein